MTVEFRDIPNDVIQTGAPSQFGAGVGVTATLIPNDVVQTGVASQFGSGVGIEFGGLGEFADLVAPIISNFVPAPASVILRTASISVDVTDNLGSFARIIVQAVFSTGEVEVIHDGTSFKFPFVGSQTPIGGGFTYSFSRSYPGWPTAGLTIRIFGIDSSGNEATPLNYSFTVSNPLDPEEVVTYYKMRGRDQVCAVQPAYVYWVVAGSPDLTAAEFNPVDLPCGTTPSIDIVDITVAALWTEG